MNMLTSSLLLLAALANLILLVMVLRRTAKPSSDPLDAVRTELRLGRDEARTSSKELREEVSNRIQVMDDALRGALTSHGQLQQNHHSGMATQMQELVRASSLPNLNSVRTASSGSLEGFAVRRSTVTSSIRFASAASSKNEDVNMFIRVPSLTVEDSRRVGQRQA